MPDSTPVRFHRRRASVLDGVGLSILALLLLGGASGSTDRGARMFGTLTGVLMGIIAVRAFRSSTVLIADGHVTVRTLLRRHRWRLEGVLGATIKAGQVEMYRRCLLVIHLANGDDYECREMNTSPSRSAELMTMVEAIDQAARA